MFKVDFEIQIYYHGNSIYSQSSYIHTYIIGHYNPSVRIIDLVSHTTYVVCVNFIHKRRDLQFKVDYEGQIFWETFHGNFNLLSEILPEICAGAGLFIYPGKVGISKEFPRNEQLHRGKWYSKSQTALQFLRILMCLGTHIGVTLKRPERRSRQRQHFLMTLELFTRFDSDLTVAKSFFFVFFFKLQSMVTI